MGKVLTMSVLALVLVLSSSSYCDSYVNPQLQNRKNSNGTFVSNGKTSTAVFPVHGNVYPDGAYYAVVNIGNPFEQYYVDLDTGSDLLWVQCDAPCINCLKTPHDPYKPPRDKPFLVPCSDPICKSITSGGQHECDDPKEKCKYELEYADKFTSLGMLVHDDFKLVLTGPSISQSHVIFGCGFDQKPSKSKVKGESKVDGVLGLGRGEASIVSQLHKMGVTRNVVGHCLGSQNKGYIFIGDELVRSTGVTWTPMSQTGPSANHYSPGPAELFYGTKSTGVKGLHVIFDSGSTYNYLNVQAYHVLIATIKKDLEGKPIHSVRDGALPECWKGDKPDQPDVLGYFSPINLSFSGVQFQIPPAGYLIKTDKGNTCLGILDDVGELNLIGDISFQDIKVIYDNENQRIGWIKADCTRIRKTDFSAH